MSKPTVTVIILSKNEEINIAACLKSVGWADDTIVLDSGSTDKTCAIAAALGARVCSHSASSFLISEQRNWGLDNCAVSTDWVLFIDADERVTPALEQSLTDVLTSAPPSVVAFQLTPKFMFMGRWLRRTQGYPNWHDRLVRRGYVRFSGGVWEHFDTEGEIRQITEPYLHYAVSKGLTDWFERHNRYSTAESEDICQRLRVSHQSDSTVTARKTRLRAVAARLWFLRPFVRFHLMYFVRLGFLDGLTGLIYSLMVFTYEMMVLLKVTERRHALRGEA